MVASVSRRQKLIGFGLLALGILVQIQATIQLGGSDVRANAADIALAVLSPFILYGFYANFSRLWEVAGKHLPVLVVAASILLSFSMFRGYEANEGLSPWAIIKYAGWYILLFYLLFGMLISIVARQEDKEGFVLGFISFQIVLILAFVAARYSGNTTVIILGDGFTGFSGNPNAMAFFLISGFALSLAYIGRTDISPRWLTAMLWAAGALLAGILFTNSIGALLAIASVLLFAAAIRVATLLHLLKVLVLGVSLWMTPQLIASPPSMVVTILHKLFNIVVTGTLDDRSNIEESRYYVTVQIRIDGYLAALSMWQKQPVFGAGLGVHLHRQKNEEKPDLFKLQIHNTALWLLAEMGLAGFLIMACIFIVVFHKVWSLARAPPGGEAADTWFPSAVLLILFGWAVMSLFHEMMYQRILWLLTGMALTAPVEALILWKRNSVT